MSHHLSGPDLRSPRGDARLDLTDLFAFPAAAAPGRTVLIMNVNPYAPTQAAEFHPDAVYRINIDSDGDDRADVAYSFTFSGADTGGQTVTVHRATGEAARSHEAAGDVLFSAVPVAFGDAPDVVEANGHRLSVGLRSDPFFADLEGIVNDFTWTGKDAMADANVFGIALEVPDAELGPDPTIGVWARVSLREDGRLVSVDRGAHPSLTAYFNAEEVLQRGRARRRLGDVPRAVDGRPPAHRGLHHRGGDRDPQARPARRPPLRPFPPGRLPQRPDPGGRRDLRPPHHGLRRQGHQRPHPPAHRPAPVLPPPRPPPPGEVAPPGSRGRPASTEGPRPERAPGGGQSRCWTSVRPALSRMRARAWSGARGWAKR
ncbi:DUF4331 family protein [Kitasatospora sp. NPDC047058]|uniref:DUF4331 family protein n=1 Tax=Kitasatospora sp. NPDC047058 TaxID=3155620 RepID=UPI0033C33110